MVFDVGNGLSLMGTSIARTAGEYLLQNQKGELERDSQRLAHDLAMQRQTQQQGFQTEFEKNVHQPFEREQTEKKIAGQKDVAQIGASAHLGAAGIAASASRYHSDVLAQIEKAKSDTELEKTRMIWGEGGGKERIEDKRIQVLRDKLNMVTLPDESARFFAKQYIETGKLSTGGMGGAMAQNQIRSMVPTILKEMGITDDQMRAKWGTREAAQKDLDNQVKMGGMIATYTQTLHKNIDGAIEQIEGGALGPSGVPAIDRLIQAGRGMIGDDKLSPLEFQLKTIAAEAAKLTTGQLGVAGLPEGARTTYEHIVSSMQNKETLARLFKTMQADAYNRLSSQQANIDAAQSAVSTGSFTPLPNRPGGPSATPNNPAPVPPMPTRGDGTPDMQKMTPGATYTFNGRTVTYHPETPDTPFWPVPGR